jgi:hypothetical protein
MPSGFQTLLSPSEPEPPLLFHYEPTTGVLTVHGYPVEEVVLMLAAYREHQRELMDLVHIAPSPDAVHYTPMGPEDVR